jgi:hypothetical protein
LRIVDRQLSRARGFRTRVEKVVKERGNPDWTETTIDLIRLYEKRVESRRAEAVRGEELALAALREAMGLPPLACLVVAAEALPDPQVAVDRCQIIALAVERHGRVVQADAVARLSRLEADAQARLCSPLEVSTFAAFGDIHSEVVPEADYHEAYRPGAVPMAMPVTVGGRRSSRVQLVGQYADRNAAAADKARALIALQAEEAYLRWQQARTQLRLRREAQDIAAGMLDRLTADFNKGARIVIETLLANSFLAALAEAEYNEVLFDKLVALLNLERVTAGGFRSGLIPACGSGGPLAAEAAPPRH